MIKYYGFKNKYNYDVLQIRIDFENKTYKTGQFKILSKSDILTRKSFYNKIEELKEMEFKNENEK